MKLDKKIVITIILLAIAILIVIIGLIIMQTYTFSIIAYIPAIIAFLLLEKWKDKANKRFFYWAVIIFVAVILLIRFLPMILSFIV